MKKGILYSICALLLLSAISTASSKQRIGVYDSRAIAIWYFNTPEFRIKMQDMMKTLQKAKQDKDTAKIKDLEERGPLMQRIAHDKGFGRGSVAEIIEKQQEELKTIAKKENLIAIVSKWELNFTDPEIEIVDITLSLLDLLKADDNVKKYLEEMKKTPPIEDAFFISPME